MADLWYPEAVRNLAHSDLWGGDTPGVPYRGVLHKTQSTWYVPFGDPAKGQAPSRTYDGFGHDFFPEFTADDDGTIYQHMPANASGRALKNLIGGVETNRWNALQIEMVGLSDANPYQPPAQKAAVRRWMRWSESVLGIKRKFPPRGIKAYPASFGNNGLRFTADEWRNYDGWCCHMHVPENDHGDTGIIDLAYYLADDQEDDMYGQAERDEAIGRMDRIISLLAESIGPSVGRQEVTLRDPVNGIAVMVAELLGRPAASIDPADLADALVTAGIGQQVADELASRLVD
jgi:hypothetical protein